MELSQLKYFYEAAKEEHVTRAADKLHLAQPALTKSIKALEDELGVKLFYKAGRGVKLTEYGEYLKKKLEPLLRELELLPQTVEKMTDAAKNTVTLNVLAASTLITDIIIKFKKKYPDAIFRMTRKEGGTDCDINVLTNTSVGTEFEAEEKAIIEEKIFIAVPKNSLLAQKDSVDLTELKYSDFITLSGKRRFRLLCDYFCEYAGFSPHVIFESDSLIAVKNLVRAGEGVAFWPHFSWGKVNGNMIKLLKIDNLDCHREIVVVQNSSRGGVSPMSKVFYGFLVRELSKKY